MATTNVSSAEERRAADRDRIEHAARALLSSEGWQHWVQVRSRAGAWSEEWPEEEPIAPPSAGSSAGV